MPPKEYVVRLLRLFRDIAAYVLIKGFNQPNLPVTKTIVETIDDSMFYYEDEIAWKQRLPGNYRRDCLSEADRIIKKQISVFELKEYCVGPKIQWNFDYQNKIIAPLKYAPFLDLKSYKTVGDIKYVFELNKHQDLPRLAQAFVLSHDPCYIEELISRIDSWIDQCPYMIGINWTSPSVSAYRLCSWTITYELLKGRYRFPRKFVQKWARSVFQHITFISKNYSLYSSAGNHLISEATGVFVASLRWKSFFDGKEKNIIKKAEKQAFSILLYAMESQFHEDGVNCEQSASYHLFACQQMFFAYWIGDTSNVSFPLSFRKRLKKAGRFLSTILNSQGRPPNYGDEDNAWAFRLSAQDSNKFLDQADLFALMFGDPNLSMPDRVIFSETAYWFFSTQTAKTCKTTYNNALLTGKKSPLKEQFFHSGGYYVATFNRWNEKEIFFFVDSGPLGLNSTGGHGHSDALSFCLTIGGIDVFVDSGTYVYKDTKERRKLRSTAAHNTLCFEENCSQDQYLGPFLWGKRHSAKGRIAQPGQFFGEVTWFSGERHERKTWLKFNELIIQDRWFGESSPSISVYLNPELCGSVHNKKNGTIFVETDVFDLKISNCGQRMLLEKASLSPAFYELHDTLRIVVPTNSPEGTNVLKMVWNFS